MLAGGDLQDSLTVLSSLSPSIREPHRYLDNRHSSSGSKGSVVGAQQSSALASGHDPGCVPFQLCDLGASHSAIKRDKSIPFPSASELAKGTQKNSGNGHTLASVMAYRAALPPG